MSCTLQETETAVEAAADKGPYKKRKKPCIVCGKPSVGVTSYIFQADGRSKIGVPFCQLHLDNSGAYASPVFENQDALELFKKEHPGLYNRCVKGKTILFLNSPKTSGEKTFSKKNVEGGREWLDLRHRHRLRTAYLALTVPALVSLNPPKVLQTPAPYTHALNADPLNFGEIPNASQLMGTKFKDGFAETVA